MVGRGNAGLRHTEPLRLSAIGYRIGLRLPESQNSSEEDYANRRKRAGLHTRIIQRISKKIADMLQGIVVCLLLTAYRRSLVQEKDQGYCPEW